MKPLVQDIPVYALASTSGTGWAVSALAVLNPILQAIATVVAIVAGIATVWLTVLRIKALRQARHDPNHTHAQSPADREDSAL